MIPYSEAQATNKLYSPPTPFERMLERACENAGVPLSAPMILWNPRMPERIVVARGTPDRQDLNKMLYYAREYRVPNARDPISVLSHVLRERMAPVEELLIDSTITPYDIAQSTYTVHQRGRDLYDLQGPHERPCVATGEEMEEAISRLLLQYLPQPTESKPQPHYSYH